ncbi:MAG: hypothetical protein ACREJ3_04825 [Polyangiaceae bacterium]
MTHALGQIRDWLREECDGVNPDVVTVETVRGLRGMVAADHDALIWACFRVCNVRGHRNLGKADAMKMSRGGRRVANRAHGRSNRSGRVTVFSADIAHERVPRADSADVGARHPAHHRGHGDLK